MQEIGIIKGKKNLDIIILKSNSLFHPSIITHIYLFQGDDEILIEKESVRHLINILNQVI